MRKTQLLLLLGWLCLVACTKNQDNASPATDIITLKNADNDQWQRPTDCRANIAKVVCVVDPEPYNLEAAARACLGDEATYVSIFERLYDNYPSPLQKMFCSIRHIYIEKEFFATAYAGQVTNKDGSKAPGVILGIRKSVIDENLSMAVWSSWKEQLSFGGVYDKYEPRFDLPYFEASFPNKVNDLLYFVVAHEFGHFFDFANNVNTWDASCKNGEDCAAVKGTWSSLSWSTKRLANNLQNFLNRSGLCFYQCNNKFLLSNSANQIYSDLEKSNFVSTYAASNPYDDFAESVAYHAIEKNLNAQVLIYSAQGYDYDPIQKLHSPQFAEKYNYIEKLFAQPDLKYP